MKKQIKEIPNEQHLGANEKSRVIGGIGVDEIGWWFIDRQLFRIANEDWTRLPKGRFNGDFARVPEDGFAPQHWERLPKGEEPGEWIRLDKLDYKFR